jgi:hypothetical protein
MIFMASASYARNLAALPLLTIRSDFIDISIICKGPANHPNIARKSQTHAIHSVQPSIDGVI